MEIKLLYLDGCPSWQETKAEIEQLLRERAIEASVELVHVADNDQAQRLQFVGSPTVQVNGKDVDPEAPQSGFNMECRLYWVDGKPVGKPPRQWLVDAIEAA